MQCLSLCRRSDPSSFIATSRCWSERLNLLNDSLSGIYLVNYRKEACQFSFMTWQHFQLLDQVISTLSCKQRQFVNI